MAVADFLSSDNAGDIVPCTRFQHDKDDLPGFSYRPDENSGFSEFDFPCVTYDSLNETSKKEAMKRAMNTGLEELERLKSEVNEELEKERFKETVQGSNFSD